MPKGPKGEKRPADVLANAVHVMRIVTGRLRTRRAMKARTPPPRPQGRAGVRSLSR
jgi:hypothetical protein